MPPANPPPADDATPTEQPTPGAGGAGDVDQLHEIVRVLQSGMADIKRDLRALIAERDALRAAAETTQRERDAMFEEIQRLRLKPCVHEVVRKWSNDEPTEAGDDDKAAMAFMLCPKCGQFRGHGHDEVCAALDRGPAADGQG
jgi:hypothetical protein